MRDGSRPAAKYIENGQFTLMLEEPSASWTTASTIAKIINDAEGDDGRALAVAVDPKNVVVTIPPIERERPDSFISRVQRLPVAAAADRGAGADQRSGRGR